MMRKNLIEKEIDKVCKKISEAYAELGLLKRRRKTLLDEWAELECPFKIGQILTSSEHPVQTPKNIMVINITGEMRDKYLFDKEYIWSIDVKLMDGDTVIPNLNSRKLKEQDFENVKSRKT